MYAASGDSGDGSGLTGTDRSERELPGILAVGDRRRRDDPAAIAADRVLWQTGWESAANTLTGGSWIRLTPPLLSGAGGGKCPVRPADLAVRGRRNPQGSAGSGGAG